MRAKPTLLDRAHAWLSEDPDSDTQEELRAALDTPNAERNKKLETWFGSSLSFGTAGLRGPLGPGPNRMNELVVARTSAGICAWLRARVQSAPERGICIGYDARRKSLQFAQTAAEIFTAQGFVAHIFESTVPTPLLAFAVTELDASAGIMITASHNPPNYNGCKVFWENGAQIIPPNDTGIASEIKNIGAYTTIDRAVYKEALRQGRVRHVGPEMRRRYLEGIARATPHAPRTIRIVYTALHGVGDRLAREAMQKAGFTQVTTVPDQAEPDGSFPTLELPNPEEPSALRKVLALAEVCGADLALANDPDADRLAVACKDETRFRILNGNEIGCLLAHHLLRSKKNSRSTKGPCILSSIVSSPWIYEIGKIHQCRVEQTLTGFKWISNRALELEAEGYDVVFGYEEALGYSVGSLVRDKDGIGAAVAFADLVDRCTQEGRTLVQELENLWRRTGLFMSRQVSRVLDGEQGSQTIREMMHAVRSCPPHQMADWKVASISDLQTGLRRYPDGKSEQVPLPRSNVLSISLEPGHRVMIRPSGTEPKIKLYFDVRLDFNERDSFALHEQYGNSVLDALESALEAHFMAHMNTPMSA